MFHTLWIYVFSLVIMTLIFKEDFVQTKKTKVFEEDIKVLDDSEGRHAHPPAPHEPMDVCSGASSSKDCELNENIQICSDLLAYFGNPISV